MRDIRKNIRDLRVNKGMTQDQLAEKLFITRQTVSNYETGKSRPDIDMLDRIAETLDADIREILYGPEKNGSGTSDWGLIAGGLLSALFGILWAVLLPYAQGLRQTMYYAGMYMLVLGLLRPLCFLCCGWTGVRLLAVALKKKPIANKWLQYTGWVLLGLTALWLLLAVWFLGATVLNDWMFANHLRGEWFVVDDVNEMGWKMLPPPVPEWVRWVGWKIVLLPVWVYPLWGGLLCLCGMPLRQSGISSPPRDNLS